MECRVSSKEFCSTVPQRIWGWALRKPERPQKWWIYENIGWFQKQMPGLRSHLICRKLNTKQACEHKFNHRCCYFLNNCITYLSCFVCSGPHCCTRALGAALWVCAQASHGGGLSVCSAGPRRPGFRSRGMWARQLWFPGSRVPGQSLWCAGLAAPRHMGSSRTRERARVPRIRRRVPNHWPLGKSYSCYCKNSSPH